MRATVHLSSDKAIRQQVNQVVDACVSRKQVGGILRDFKSTRKWRHTLVLIDIMRERRMQLEARDFTVAISTLRNAKEWRQENPLYYG